jgi:hypothetical protein
MAVTRTIDLRSPEQAITEERFGLFYSLMLLGALIQGQKERRTLEDTRCELKLMDLIAAISTVDENKENKTAIGSPMRVLKAGAEPVFKVDQPTHSLIVKYMEVAIPAVVPEVSYRAIPVLDVINGAEKGEGDA